MNDKVLKRKAIRALKRVPVMAQRVLDRIEAREELTRYVCPKCGCRYVNPKTK